MATVLLEKGVPLKIVSDLLGHASVSVTGDIYSHATRKAKRDAANVLEKIIAVGEYLIILERRLLQQINKSFQRPHI